MSAVSGHAKLPADTERCLDKAIRLEWWSLAYMATAVVVVFVVLGSSQAMKAAWVEDILSLFPPAAFLLADRFRHRQPNDRFPYGFHRSISIGYLTAALALLTMGLYIAYDSMMRLARFEHPPIGLIKLPFLDPPIWHGWLMLAALAYTGIPPVLLGRAKLKLARDLHDKVLFADAEMNKADWMTAGAAAVGIIAIGFGLWWADAVAALFISGDIVHDGWKNVRAATYDLMDAHPRRYDDSGPHPLIDELHAEMCRLPWVQDCRVRLREQGHVFVGEVFVQPVDDVDLLGRLDQAAARLRAMDWRLHDVAVVPMRRLGPAGNLASLAASGDRTGEAPARQPTGS